MDRALCLFRSPDHSKPNLTFGSPSHLRSEETPLRSKRRTCASEDLSFCPRSKPAHPSPTLGSSSFSRFLLMLSVLVARTEPSARTSDFDSFHPVFDFFSVLSSFFEILTRDFLPNSYFNIINPKYSYFNYILGENPCLRIKSSR